MKHGTLPVCLLSMALVLACSGARRYYMHSELTSHATLAIPRHLPAASARLHQASGLPT